MATYKRYQKYQKYVNGEPTNEYKQGEYIDTGEYDSKSDCEGGAIYEWRDDLNSYICDSWHSYYKAYRYKSLDGGETWTKTGSSYQKGSLKEWESKECGWKLLERWVATGETKCLPNGDKGTEYIKQESRDMGETWHNTDPAEYKYEVLAGDHFSEECVLQMEPMTFEITVEEDDLEVWIEALCGKYVISESGKTEYLNYYINWGESDYHQKYSFATKKVGNILIGLNGYENVSANYGGNQPTGYVYDNPGTYTIKLWMPNMSIFGGIWKLKYGSGGMYLHCCGIHLLSEGFTYKIKSWGEIRSEYLQSINLVFTPLTEICPDNGFLSPLAANNSITRSFSYSYIAENYTDVNIADFFSGNQGAAGVYGHYLSCWNTQSYPRSTTYPSSAKINFDISNTLLTEIPEGMLDSCSNMVSIRMSYTKVPTLPATLFQNCTSLANIQDMFYKSEITEIPDGLFANCPIEYINYAFCYSKLQTFGANQWKNNPQANYAFYKCTDLNKVGGDLRVNGKYMNYMFAYCENFKQFLSPGSFEEVNGQYEAFVGAESMYAYSGVEGAIDPSQNFDYHKLINSMEMGGNLKNMFRGCNNLTGVNVDNPLTGNPLENYAISTDMSYMFADCQNIESVVLKIHSKSNTSLSISNMFRNCRKLKTINEDMFLEDSDIQAQYTFAGCVSLENYPKVGDKALWDYQCFYNAQLTPNHIEYHWTFLNCPLIDDVIPIEFGGWLLRAEQRILYPVKVELNFEDMPDSEYKSAAQNTTTITISGTLIDNIGKLCWVDWGDGTVDYSTSDSTFTHTTDTTEKQYITLWTSGSGWKLDTSTFANLKILDFGGCATPDFTRYYDFNDGPNYRNQKPRVIYLGKDSGSFLRLTEFPHIRVDWVKEINEDFLKYGTNINTFNPYDGFVKMHTIPPFLLKNLPNLTSISGIVSGTGSGGNANLSEVQVVDEIFEGITSVLSWNPFSATGRIYSANRTFKDSSVTDSRNLISVVVYGESMYENSTFNSKSRTTNLLNGKRMFANCKNILNFDQSVIVNNNGDYTEMFSDCSNLQSVDVIWIYPQCKSTETMNVDLTRMFQNCTSLSKAPSAYIYYTDRSKSGKLWEFPGIIGTECFKGCTQLQDYDEIPDDWK